MTSYLLYKYILLLFRILLHASGKAASHLQRTVSYYRRFHPHQITHFFQASTWAKTHAFQINLTHLITSHIVTLQSSFSGLKGFEYESSLKYVAPFQDCQCSTQVLFTKTIPYEHRWQKFLSCLMHTLAIVHDRGSKKASFSRKIVDPIYAIEIVVEKCYMHWKARKLFLPVFKVFAQVCIFFSSRAKLLQSGRRLLLGVIFTHITLLLSLCL